MVKSAGVTDESQRPSSSRKNFEPPKRRPRRSALGDDTTSPDSSAGVGARASASHDLHSGEVVHGKKGKAKKTRKEQPWYIEIPVVILITLVVVALIQTFIGRLYVIPSQSMEPTLHGCSGCTGDRIFVDKLSYDFSKPKPGDVIVFKGPESWNNHFVSHRSKNPIVRGLENLGSFVGIVAPDENDLVKRIVAVGGQTVQCLPGDPGVVVDGKQIDSSYILSPSYYPVDPTTGSEACGGRYFGPLTVPAGNVFVMGDNRTNSADSRYHMGDELQGTIPESNIIGKVQAIAWPPSRIGRVHSLDIQFH